MDKGFKWWCVAVKREKRKGRARGGMVIGIKEEWSQGKDIVFQVINEGAVKVDIGEGLHVYSVYNQGNLKEIWKYLENVEGEEERRMRKSKDKKVSNEEKVMMEVICKKGWNILNSNTDGDEEGEFTYIGPRGASVMDYVIVSEDVWGER
ncbi:hypothetical protein TKK_0011083 [Trichogramma kaykai]